MKKEDSFGSLTVLGFDVPVDGHGRKIWPADLRAIAVQRVLDGARINVVADEIGVHKSLLAKWVAKVRERPTSDAPAFVEVLTAVDEPGPTADKNASQPVTNATCTITLGGVEVAIPADFPAGQLTNILRAVRASL